MHHHVADRIQLYIFVGMCQAGQETVLGSLVDESLSSAHAVFDRTPALSFESY